LDSEVILTTETVVMDTRKLSLSSSTSTGLAIAQANVHKVVDVEKKMKEYERKITLLENQVNYYKSNKYQTSNFIDYAFKVQNELNNVQREFYDRAQHVQAQGQDIVDVMTHIQAWELAYQQAQLQFDKVRD
jgi:uncharacterized protein YpuA (DUF1002 family)